MSRRRYPRTPRLREPSLDVESWSERIDQPLDQDRHSRQVGEDEPMLRIAQGYIDGRVTLHLHLRIRTSGLDQDPDEFCGVVASDHGAVSHVQDLAYVADGERIPGEIARELAFSSVGD